jgi:hypothetical protein
MSIKLWNQVQVLRAEKKEMVVRLDKLEKEVNTLKRSVSHIERHGTSDGTVVVPQIERPETLDKLEIGRSSQG